MAIENSSVQSVLKTPTVSMYSALTDRRWTGPGRELDMTTCASATRLDSRLLCFVPRLQWMLLFWRGDLRRMSYEGTGSSAEPVASPTLTTASLALPSATSSKYQPCCLSSHPLPRIVCTGRVVVVAMSIYACLGSRTRCQ